MGEAVLVMKILKRCVEFGINKINVGCDFMNANVDSIKKHLKKDPDINYWVMMHQVEIDSQELVKKVYPPVWIRRKIIIKISTSKRRNRTMLMNMKELLKVADEKGFAVPAFNIGSDQLLKAVMQQVKEIEEPSQS